MIFDCSHFRIFTFRISHFAFHIFYFYIVEELDRINPRALEGSPLISDPVTHTGAALPPPFSFCVPGYSHTRHDATNDPSATM